MIFLGILLRLAGIGLLCWFLFTLAVFALPSFVGVTAGVPGPIGTGAGIPRRVLVGIARRRVTFDGRPFSSHSSARVAEARLAVAAPLAASGGRRLSRDTWSREAPPCRVGLADRVLDRRCSRGRHHRLLSVADGTSPSRHAAGFRSRLISAIALLGPEQRRHLSGRVLRRCWDGA